MVPLPLRSDTLYLEPSDTFFWSRYLAESGTLYIRYTAIRRPSDTSVADIREAAARPDVERVVLDLRQNGGGDNHTYTSLLSALRSPEIDQPGRLFVLTDRVTFSAAANLATEIEQGTDAIFAGEPMGGGLNFWDDVTWIELASLPVPMRVGISVRYWEKSAPDDPRLTIEPQIAIPVRAADYFTGRDPVLEAVIRAD
jgi:hypothetical protein